MKPKEEYLIGVQFPSSRSPRDFNMVLIAMQKYAEDYHSQFSQPSDVSDEDIKKWAENQWAVQTMFNYKGDGADLIMMGAKAMRDGQVKSTK